MNIHISSAGWHFLVYSVIFNSSMFFITFKPHWFTHWICLLLFLLAASAKLFQEVHVFMIFLLYYYHFPFSWVIIDCCFFFFGDSNLLFREFALISMWRVPAVPIGAHTVLSLLAEPLKQQTEVLLSTEDLDVSENYREFQDWVYLSH